MKGLVKKIMRYINNDDIHKIIEDAMEKKNRYVSIFVSESGTNVSIYPNLDDAEWVYSYYLNKYICPDCERHYNQPSRYCSNCGTKLKRPNIYKNNENEE